MKLTKSIALSLLLMIVVAAVYRVIPGRPYGFAPQIAIALFGGAFFRNRLLAFVLPLLSMFLSDALYQLLYSQGLSPIPGFYSGQIWNYLVFASVVLVGFFIRRVNVKNVLLGSLAGATWFFIVSNFLVWITGSGLTTEVSAASFVSTYVAAIPFYGWSVLATVLFSSLLFGLHYRLLRRESRGQLA